MRIETAQPRIHSDEQLQRFHEEGRWGKRLLVDYLDEQARNTPEKAAIVETHRVLTYRQLVRLTENVAASLLGLGIRKGDVVAIQAPNWAELPIVHFAADRIGAIFLPLSEGFRERELLHLLRQSRARVVFCPEVLRGFAYAAQVEGWRASLPQLEHVVTMRGTGSDGRSTFEEMGAAERWRSDAGATVLAPHRPDPDDPSHVMVSSGTTGLPRSSLFSDNNTIVKLLQHYVRAAKVSGADVAAALAPAGTGATGYNYPILTMLLIGGTSVMLEHWSGSQVERVLELLERRACTVAVVVPAQLTKLVQAAESKKYDLSALRVITNSGSKLPPSLAESAERVLACRVQSIYGSSEAGATAMTSVDDPEEKRRSTVGRPLDGQEVQIVGDGGAAVGADEVGEVCWRGANKSYGFLNNPDDTRTVWGDDGWLRSGDLGFLDREGYLHIVGRKKDMIIRGGQNVNPGAIEEVLLNHPAIAEVAVVPFDDSVLGERIAACVVPRGEAMPSLESLKSLVLARGLAPWNQPELLVTMDTLPRNAGGKIDKRSLSATATAASARNAQKLPT